MICLNFTSAPKESGLNQFSWGPLSQCYTQARPIPWVQIEPYHNPEGDHGVYPRALSPLSDTAFQFWPWSHTGFSVKCSAMSLWAQKFPQLLIIRKEMFSGFGLTQPSFTDDPCLAYLPFCCMLCFWGAKLSAWECSSFWMYVSLLINSRKKSL